MKRYIKDNIIKNIEDINITIEVNEKKITILNPSEEMILNDGWEEFEDTAEDLKKIKLQEIINYDKSEDVNKFFINNFSLWLSREERIVIKDRFQREKDAGKEKTRLLYKGLVLELTPDMGIHLINMVSAYADQCFDITEAHKSALNDLTTKEEIQSYDYTVGYPEKISITL